MAPALDVDGPPRNSRRNLADTARLVWSASSTLALSTAALSLLLSLAPAAALWVGKLVLDQVAIAVQGGFVTAAVAYRQLALLLVLQVGIGAATAALTALQRSAQELLGDTLHNGIHLQILEKTAALDVAHFENPATYNSLRNAYTDVDQRPLGVVVQLLTILQALIVLTSIGTLIARLGMEVVLLVVLASIPGVIVSFHFGAQSFRIIMQRATAARHQSYLGSILMSDLHVKEARLFAFEPYLLARWRRYYDTFRRELEVLLTRRTLWSVAAAIASSVLVGVATLFALRRATAGTITVGDFSLLVLSIVQVQSQFSALLTGFSRLHEGLLYMGSLFHFLALPVPEQTHGAEWRGPIEQIEFDRVSFRYPLTSCDAVSNLSFTVGRGEILALVGENGAGKTTIVKLLARLFEPTSGRILFNGMDAADFSPASLRKEISVIFQDYGQYHMTVRENLAISHVGRLGDTAALEAAAATAGAADVVDRLPDRFETMLGRMFPGGHQLSGGEWQRLALARQHFRPASVRVFDEPTAALDAVGEAEVIERLRTDAADCIGILISHRLSTIRAAGTIVVLSAGRIIETGSHEVLMSQPGTYASIFGAQAADGIHLNEAALRTTV